MLEKKLLSHMETPIILSDTWSDKWLNSLELVSPFGDQWPYYGWGLRGLINHLTHAPRKAPSPLWAVFHGISLYLWNSVHLSYFDTSVQCCVGRAAENDKSLPHAKTETLLWLQLCLRGSGWNMTGVHFWLPLLKANEFPDNKMVGRSRWAGDWEVISRLLLGADGAAADCDDSRPIAAKENISLETAHLKGSGPSLTLYGLTCAYAVWECVFISHRYRGEKWIQFSSSLDRWKPNREFKNQDSRLLLDRRFK